MSGKYIRKCPVCDETFISKKLLHLHCIKIHPTKFICCSICYEPLKHDDFVKHSNLHHNRRMRRNNGINGDDFKPIKSYKFGESMVNGSKCMACLRCFCTQYYAKNHYKDVHLRTKYLCHRCPRFFSSLNILKCHYIKAHESKCESDDSTDSSFELGGSCKSSTGSDDSTDSSVKLGGNCKSSASTAYDSRRRRNVLRNNDLPLVKLAVEADVQFMPTEEEPEPLLRLTSRCMDGSVKLLPYVMNDYEQTVELSSDDTE